MYDWKSKQSTDQKDKETSSRCKIEVPNKKLLFF